MVGWRTTTIPIRTGIRCTESALNWTTLNLQKARMRGRIMTRTKKAAGAGALETGEDLRAEEEVIPVAGAVPEVLAHPEAVQDVTAEVLVLQGAVNRKTAPEIADPRGIGM